VNSLSLTFEPKEQTTKSASLDTITLGAGCFWCVEAVFEELKGVKRAVSGYSGGKTSNPTYSDICTGKTGHAHVAQVPYDQATLSLKDLLEVFFTLHDPTTLTRHGPDSGTQYRSAVFYHNNEQKKSAQNVIATLNKNKVFDDPIVTEVTAFKKFYT